MRYRPLMHLLAWLLLGVAGTSQAWAEANPSGEPRTRIVFKRAAVASFLEGRRRPELDETMDQTLSCPIGQICQDDPSILPQAGITLTRLVNQQLRGRFGEQVIPRIEVQAAEMEIKLNQEKDTPLTLAEKLAAVVGESG